MRKGMLTRKGMATLGLCAALLLPSTAPAYQYHYREGELAPLTSACLQDAALRHGVLVLEMLMILYSEQGSSGKNTSNTNNTYDVGLFQINSIHLENVRRTFGFSETQLRNDGCANAEVAAWLLSKAAPAHRLAQAQTEDEYFSILARYHSVTPKHNARYAKLLRNAFYKLQRGGGS